MNQNFSVQFLILVPTIAAPRSHRGQSRGPDTGGAGAGGAAHRHHHPAPRHLHHHGAPGLNIVTTDGINLPIADQTNLAAQSPPAAAEAGRGHVTHVTMVTGAPVPPGALEAGRPEAGDLAMTQCGAGSAALTNGKRNTATPQVGAVEVTQDQEEVVAHLVMMVSHHHLVTVIQI